MGMHERERCVVADSTDVTEMIGEPFQLGHQSPQILRARRRFNFECRFDCMREGDAVGNGAVARSAPSKLCRTLDGRAGHERFNAFMDVAEALLEPRNGFASRGEAEVAGLDDSGMHRADRYLMQVLAFYREKCVSRSSNRSCAARTQRMPHVPKAEIEPRPRVRSTNWFEPVQTENRAFGPDGGRMHRAN